ncbi:hypothetical protein IT570_08410 [Candidatus Sumerlaeota bacterium]|nr:hypothetical protein [Candidatus Sumerlaeota bacterium]
MKRNSIARLTIAAFAISAVYMLNSCAAGRIFGPPRALSYHVVEVVDGKTELKDLNFACDGGQPGIVLSAVMSHRHYMQRHATISPDEAGALRMVMAYQLMPGKTRADIARFKEFDRPWVVENNGFNTATYFTRRAATWPFDAFEDITFKSRADFEKAYAGNETMTKAGEGLFGPEVLVAIVTADE